MSDRRIPGGQAFPRALRRRVQRAQEYISKAAATSITHTQQIRLTMVRSIAIPAFA